MRKFVLFFMAVFGCCVCALAQNGKVSGTVTSADGKPIAGATVVIEGSHVGTSTNADGKYTLKGGNGCSRLFSLQPTGY